MKQRERKATKTAESTPKSSSRTDVAEVAERRTTGMENPWQEETAQHLEKNVITVV